LLLEKYPFSCWRRVWSIVAWITADVVWAWVSYLMLSDWRLLSEWWRTATRFCSSDENTWTVRKALGECRSHVLVRIHVRRGVPCLSYGRVTSTQCV
jgi:hypothetical protein